MAGWQGTTEFFSGPSISGHLHVEVDWAVFAPGTYNRQTSFSPLFNSDSLMVKFGLPDFSNNYLYAYQIYVLPDSDSSINGLSIGTGNLLASASPTITSMGQDASFDSSADDVEATYAFNGSTGAKFQLDTAGGDLQAGDFSVVLLMASTSAPRFFSSYVFDGGHSDQRLLPSPSVVPAPSATVLTSLGLAFFALPLRRLIQATHS